MIQKYASRQLRCGAWFEARRARAQGIAGYEDNRKRVTF